MRQGPVRLHAKHREFSRASESTEQVLAQEGDVTSTMRIRDGCWLHALGAGNVLRVSESNLLEFMASVCWQWMSTYPSASEQKKQQTIAKSETSHSPESDLRSQQITANCASVPFVTAFVRNINPHKGKGTCIKSGNKRAQLENKEAQKICRRNGSSQKILLAELPRPVGEL